ncbi:MAG: hypothetical protein ACRD07_00515, partial [Acidimicrobiales bacterium]
MPSDPDRPDAVAAEQLRDLRTELDAERAAVENWRRIARQRSEDLAALSDRTSVRALLGVERRVRPVATRARSAGRRMASAAERLA